MVRHALVPIAALAAWPGAASAAEVIATEHAPVHADAHGGRIAWSSFDRDTRAWHLATSEDGKASRTSARPAPHPLRLDMGPGPDGRPVAVYARCRDEARCDLYLYDFARRRERKLRGLSTRAASESLPSIWRSRIAFARRAGGVSRLYTARLDGSRLRSMPGGRQTAPAGPLAIELRRRRTAFVWSRRGEDGFTETTLWLARRGRLRLLDRTHSGRRRSTSFVTPEIDGRRVYYARTATGRRRGNQLRRAHIRRGTLGFARAPFRGVVTAVWQDGRFLLSRAREAAFDDPEAGCRRPGSDPSDTICRLLLGDRVTRWRRLDGIGG